VCAPPPNTTSAVLDQRGREADARDLAEQALAIDLPRARHEQPGVLQDRHGDATGAMTLFTRALQIDPEMRKRRQCRHRAHQPAAAPMAAGSRIAVASDPAADAQQPRHRAQSGRLAVEPDSSCRALRLNRSRRRACQPQALDQHGKQASLLAVLMPDRRNRTRAIAGCSPPRRCRVLSSATA
jgi:hypothetical protein